MFRREEEIREGLSHRPVRSGAAAWPDIRRRLESRPASLSRWRLGLAALAVVLLAAAALHRRAAAPSAATAARGFRVSRVESRGRTSTPLVLQPDGNTVMIIVSD
jgi:hypothetical protein